MQSEDERQVEEEFDRIGGEVFSGFRNDEALHRVDRSEWVASGLCSADLDVVTARVGAVGLGRRALDRRFGDERANEVELARAGLAERVRNGPDRAAPQVDPVVALVDLFEVDEEALLVEQ